MDKISTFVRTRWGSWGILILALWAIVLTLIAATNMLLLTAVVGNTNQEIAANRVWLVFLVNLFFGVGFAASAYGLWQRRNWGRRLFMGMIFIWAASYFVALFFPQTSEQYSLRALVFNFIPYIAGAAFSILYLNLMHIKMLFDVNKE